MKNDPFLEKRLVRYDQWLKNGRISFSSKVVPISESLDTKQWVLPTEQVEKLLGDASFLAVQNCECREHYGRCDHPREVCLLLNDTAKAFVKKSQARRLDIKEASEILKHANRCGLVHLSLYMPDHEIYALCSCCPCCCHELQIIRQYGRKDILVRSEYMAFTATDTCIHCGDCTERCVFGARSLKNGVLMFDEHACLGCGLCVSVCPVEAIHMAHVKTPDKDVPEG